MYVSKALGFWCDDDPCWSWSWKSATETSMLRMLCKSSCTNFGSAGPHSKAKQHDKYGKTSPSQHIYTMGVFFLDPFNYCFLAWLHTISTYKKKMVGRKLYYIIQIHQQHTSRFEGDFRAQSCSGRTMSEFVNDISPNCLEILECKTPSLKSETINIASASILNISSMMSWFEILFLINKSLGQSDFAFPLFVVYQDFTATTVVSLVR